MTRLGFFAKAARLSAILKALTQAGVLDQFTKGRKLSLPAKLAISYGKMRWDKKDSPAHKGPSLAAALESLGPSFVKLGQSLAVRVDLIGDELAKDLRSLQDQMKPFPSNQAKAIIEAELGGPLEQFYSEFSENPVAAASIAQVHRARTIDGQEVAVKILRPNIEQLFARDLAFMRWMARQIEKRFPDAKRLKPMEVVDFLAASVEVEMDLRLEAAAGAELREYFEDEALFQVPRIDWQLTSQRVMTLEWVEGKRIDDLDALKQWKIDKEDLLRRATRIVLLQVFRDGFFHADMHPGNLLVKQDGTICPLDYGIMGRLDRKNRMFLADTLIGMLKGDYERVSEAHFRHAIVPPHKSKPLFAQALRAIGEPIKGKDLNNISIASLLQHMFQTTAKFDMPVQIDLLLLQKTLIVAEGLGRIIDPKSNVWMLSQDLVEDWYAQNYGPAARAQEIARQSLESLERLPNTLARMEGLVAMNGSGPRSDFARQYNNPPERFRNDSSPLWLARPLPVLVIVAVVGLWAYLKFYS